MSKAVEREFAVHGLRLAAREWGQPGGQPIIALHGWLDNAGSFDLLAPLLDGAHIIAPDAAGHGYSAHRSADSAYNIWQDVPEVIGVADAMGWDRFCVLGHSRGGAIASLVAGTFPERVSSLLLLDGGVPIPGVEAEAPAHFAKAVLARGRDGMQHGRIFAERDTAIEQRMDGFTRINREAAELLALRSLREVEGGYSWFVDQRLKIESELRLTREQIAAFLGAVRAPALALLASDSPLTGRDWFVDLLRNIPDIAVDQVEGGHHCHMEGAEADIAQRLRTFLAAQA